MEDQRRGGRAFAKQSGGNLRIDSELGIGTKVQLYLPRSSATAIRAADDAAGVTALRRRNEPILVVDDNASMLAIAARHLSALGYSVRVAADGPAALEILRGSESFDLLFTDVLMPGGMNGYQLAAKAQELRSSIGTLFTTGYADELDHESHDIEPRRVLYKPYHRRELAEKVRAALDQAGAGLGR